jgi:hypothetical protein
MMGGWIDAVSHILEGCGVVGLVDLWVHHPGVKVGKEKEDPSIDDK